MLKFFCVQTHCSAKIEILVRRSMKALGGNSLLWQQKVAPVVPIGVASYYAMLVTQCRGVVDIVAEK